MATGVNKVILVGNLGKDPEVRYTQTGTAVSNIRLAVGERRKDGEQWVEHTEWCNVVCFGKTAENVGQYLAKGRQVYVEGRLQTRKYQDREGNDRWSTEVVANQILFLSSRGGDAPSSNAPNAGMQGGAMQGGGMQGGGFAPSAPAAQNNGGGSAFYDDDLPF